MGREQGSTRSTVRHVGERVLKVAEKEKGREGRKGGGRNRKK